MALQTVLVLLLFAMVCDIQGLPETVSMKTWADCPCSNPTWCEPIKEQDRKELFVFSVKNDENYWKFYDWSKLTTVVTADYINVSLVCLAHSHGARVTYMAPVDEKTFMSPELRKEWIDDHMTLVREHYLDGLNFDYEGAIGKNESAKRDAYTALVKETKERLQKEFPFSQVAVDVGWRPNVDERYYDYPALAENSDFLVLMAYDEASQIYGECVAGPNCPFPATERGVKQFLEDYGNRITPDKLVLAVPWFGISYQCLKAVGDKCYIKKIPYRGAPCSDSPGQPYDYKDITRLAHEMPDNYKWNETSSTPYIMFTNQTTGVTYQIQYDNLPSLLFKYKTVTSLDLRGVGIFHIDMLDYSDTPQGEEMRRKMFGSIPVSQPEDSEWFSDEFLDTEEIIKNRPPCPCSDPKLCEPIKDTTRNEVFAFSVQNDESHWNNFDWSKLTTVVMFNYMNPKLMCLAHSHGVRVVVSARPSKKTIFSEKLRAQWVHQQFKVVYQNYLDGLNFDFEEACSSHQRYLRKTYSKLVIQTSYIFRKNMPYTQVTVDVIDDAYSGYRHYDYHSLAKASDFLFIMAYDESTRKVGPNSDYGTAKWSINQFLKYGIPAHKLVLGLPWYGDVYQCSWVKGDTCHAKRQGGHMTVYQVCYCGLMERLAIVPDHYRWNNQSQTPYFTFQNGATYQAQYDNPKSLTLKYKLATQMGIRGVGIWHIDCVYYDDSAQAQQMRADMFGPLPSRMADLSKDKALRFTETNIHEAETTDSKTVSTVHMKVL